MKMPMLLPSLMLALLLSAGAQAQEQPAQESGTAQKAGEIITQPVRDVGIAKSHIPPLLEQAALAPYAPPSGSKCAALISDLVALNEVLGPDYDAAEPTKENKAGKLAAAGGETVVNSLIPFRGLVREISGAASADRRLAAATTAGVARRGYLRGLVQARRCRMPQ